MQLDKIGYKMDIPKTISEKLNFSGSIFLKIMKQLSIIDSFNGEWKAIELSSSRHLKELRNIATIESIGSSTRIEGATLSDDEVGKLLKLVRITKLESREQQEVVGYYEALKVVLDNYQEIEITERYIHQLHSILLKYSDKDQKYKGKYKSLSNQVVANYPDGTQRTIFKTTDPALTVKETRALLAWIRERFEVADMHPVFSTAAFVYEFLLIHPYQDGNGRLSRLLTTLLLMKQGYEFTQYVAFEHIIEERKEDYYGALMEGQKNRYQATESMEKWILFFLESLVELTNRLKVKHESFKKLELLLNKRQQQVVAYLKEKKVAKIKDIHEGLINYSRNTLKKDLAFLVNEGVIIRTGSGRGTEYHTTG